MGECLFKAEFFSIIGTEEISAYSWPVKYLENSRKLITFAEFLYCSSQCPLMTMIIYKNNFSETIIP